MSCLPDDQDDHEVAPDDQDVHNDGDGDDELSSG